MKKFLIISSILLAVSLLLVIAVFLLVSLNLNPETEEVYEAVTESPSTISGDAAPQRTTSTDRATPEATQEVFTPSEEMVTPEQAAILESVGIDTNTLTISAAQIACAEEKLSPVRIAEIQAGDTPTMLEVARLSPCLVVE